MKKILSFVLLAAMLLTTLVVGTSAAAWDGTTATEFSGEGTAEKPYLIESAANLRYLHDKVNNGESYAGAYFTQTADIDLGWYEWDPIGMTSMPFSGVYNGNGFWIVNMLITKARTSVVGLFGAVYPTAEADAGIANVNLRGIIDIDNIVNDAGVGGLVGWCYKDSTDIMRVKVTNCTVDVDITLTNCSKQPRVGGVTGYAFTTDLENVVNNGDVTIEATNNSRVGGIAGQSNRSTYVNCVNNGAITSIVTNSKGSNVGGMIGMNTYKTDVYNTLTNCVNNGAIKGTTDGAKVYAGGFIGGVYTGATHYYIKLVKCVNYGAITGEGVKEGDSAAVYAGGIISFADTDKGHTIVEDCVNAGTVTVTGKEGEVGGGIVGVMKNQNTSEHTYIKGCTTVGAAAGSIEVAGTGCTENAEAAAAQIAGKLISDALTSSATKIGGFPTEYKAAGTEPAKSERPETTAPVTTEAVTTDAPTTDEVTTETPAGDASTTDAATTDAATTEAPAEGGCGSLVSGSLVVVALVTLAGVMLKKKD